MAKRAVEIRLECLVALRLAMTSRAQLSFVEEVRRRSFSGTGMMQRFIERPSAESLADWIWMRVLSALKVGCGWSAAVRLWSAERRTISSERRSIR